MTLFSILDHISNLTPVEGKSTAATGEYYCPLCGSENFKVDLRSGAYNAFGCGCTDTDEGKRKVRDAIAPLMWEKPPRSENHQTFTYDALHNGVSESIAQVVRIDDGSGKRQFYQRHWNRHQWMKGLPDEVKAQVRLYRIFANVNEEAKGVGAASQDENRIFLVEGEGKVDALLKMGIPATCALGGAGKWKQYGYPNYLGDLEGYQVVLCPDRDEPGVKHCEEIEADLLEHGIDVAGWLYAFPQSFLWQRLPKSGGADVVDWIEEGATKDDILNAVEPRRKLEDVTPTETAPRSNATLFELAMDIAMKADYFTLPGGSGTVAADVDINGHRETFQISKRPQQFKDWLQFAMWQKHKRVLGSETMQQVISVVSCEARASGIQHKLHVRVASHEDVIYLDLGQPDWAIAKITADGWSIIPSNDCPIRFVRTSGIGELPIPQLGGSINELKRIANVDDRGLVLLLTWMLFCLCPDYDHPILIVSGSAESGKTKLCETIKTLIDPSPTLLMSLPKEERNLKAQAVNRWVLGYDNLSGMGNEISDSLCRLATGGGLVDRKLHTDDDESEFSGVRPILLNGIDALGNRSDFRSRAIEINCPPLEYKMPASEYKAALETIRPLMIGLLLNAASQALKRVPDSQHVTDTRMGDFERWGTAAETALGFPEGTFLEAFQANIVDLRNAGIEANPVASALMDFMETRDEWEGTPAELLTALEGLVSEETRRSRAFPKVPNLLGKILKRIQTDLQQCVEICSEKRNGTRLIGLRRIEESVVPVVPISSKPYGVSRLSGTTVFFCRPCVVPVDPDRDDNRDGRVNTGTAEKMVSSLPQNFSQQEFQTLRDDRDDKNRAFSKYPTPTPDSVHTPLQNDESNYEKWVYWWRVDTQVKVLSETATHWRVKVPGDSRVQSVPVEEFIHEEPEVEP